MRKSLQILLNLILKAFMIPKMFHLFQKRIKKVKIKFAAFEFLIFQIFSNYYVKFHVPPIKLPPEIFLVMQIEKSNFLNKIVTLIIQFLNISFFAKFISQIFGPFQKKEKKKLFANLLGNRKVFFSFIFVLNDAN